MEIEPFMAGCFIIVRMLTLSFVILLFSFLFLIYCSNQLSNPITARLCTVIKINPPMVRVYIRMYSGREWPKGYYPYLEES